MAAATECCEVVWPDAIARARSPYRSSEATNGVRRVGARGVALARRRPAIGRAIGPGAWMKPAERSGVEQLVEEAVGALTDEPARLDSAARCQKHAHGQAYEEEPDRDPNAAEHGFASDV